MACGGELAKFDEEILQFVGAGNDDAHAENIEFEKKPERSEVAVEKRIFIVPFSFDGNSVLIIVDVVGWG